MPEENRTNTKSKPLKTPSLGVVKQGETEIQQSTVEGIHHDRKHLRSLKMFQLNLTGS